MKGVFTATIGDIEIELCRDEDARDLLAEQEVDLAFFGDDKLQEWQLGNSVDDVEIIDSVPMECQMVLAGPRKKVRTVPTMLGKKELLTVATSYPNLMRAFAYKQDLNLVTTYTPGGSVEAYAKKGRTDLIYDIRKSGKTITANDLVVFRYDKPLSLKVVKGLTKQVPQERQLEADLEQVTQTYIKRLRQAETLASYTSMLLRDDNKLTKKLGEEGAEFLRAYLLRQPRDDLIGEAADVWYATCLALTKRGVSPLEVLNEDIRRNRAEDNKD